MSLTSSPPAAASGIWGPFVAHRVRAILRRWGFVYTAWRAERLTMRRLAELSDRQLEDIGVARSDIAFAARRRSVRDRALHQMVVRGLG